MDRPELKTQKAIEQDRHTDGRGNSNKQQQTQTETQRVRQKEDRTVEVQTDRPTDRQRGTQEKFHH
eukprot:3704021-Karenia_brevis.AAC.1